MKKLWIALLAVSFWSPAMASGTFEYRMVIDSCVVTPANPYGPPGSACNALTLNALSHISVALDSSPAAYEYVQHNGAFTVSDTGFDEIVVPHDGGVQPIYPVPSKLLCAGDCDLKVTASNAGASFLDAVFAVNTGIDTLFFSGHSGLLQSDLPSFGGSFTGHLTLVPEPSSWTLMIIASLALVVIRIAKRHPSSGARD